MDIILAIKIYILFFTDLFIFLFENHILTWFISSSVYKSLQYLDLILFHVFCFMLAYFRQTNDIRLVFISLSIQRICLLIGLVTYQHFYITEIGESDVWETKKINNYFSLNNLKVLLSKEDNEDDDPFESRTEYMYDVFLGILYCFNLDCIAMCFSILTELLFLIVSLVSWESIKSDIKLYYLLLFILEITMLLLFVVNDLLLFYILFEATLIPMFLFVGKWGSTTRRIYAAFKLAAYTLFGAILMFVAILWLYGTLGTTDYFILANYKFNFLAQLLLFIAFFSSFAIKIPMFPVHLWLPEAHVEAPTGISVLLAGILLKAGGYGFLRFAIPICKDILIYISSYMMIISLLGIIYGSLVALRQTDLKKMIAYASISHMNLVTLGLFTVTNIGISGAIYLMLIHGITSSGLFICVGVLMIDIIRALLSIIQDLPVLCPNFRSCSYYYLWEILVFH